MRSQLKQTTQSLLLLSAFSINTHVAQAGQERTEAKWEAGIALAAASLPQYPGSDERYNFAAPIPYLIYRGDRLTVDRGGITSELFGIRQLSLDASISGALPVRNNNRARAGMPDLKFSMQLGPRLNWHLLDTDRQHLTLRLPWRAMVDISGKWPGWVSEPDLLMETHMNEALELDLSISALYGSKRFMDHYYAVPPAYATATRPAYQARAGLHSVSTRAALRYDISESLTFFTSIRYRNLTPGDITNSPLVKDKNYLSVVGGITWSFWQSEERVPAE